MDSAINVAVFASGDDLALVHLEADADGSATAEAAARGYSYCGCFAVNNGVPCVQCEPGFAAARSMFYAGVLFAEMLGRHMQQQQLKGMKG
jgi:hypothetical protein